MKDKGARLYIFFCRSARTVLCWAGNEKGRLDSANDQLAVE